LPNFRSNSKLSFCILIIGRYHEQAQEDRTDEGIGPQAPKAGEKSEAPGEGSERESQLTSLKNTLEEALAGATNPGKNFA